MGDRRAKVMRPDKVKNESEIFGAVTDWEEEIKELRRLTGERILDDELMISGIKQITTGKINEWVDLKETTLNYSEIRTEVMKYAAKKRKEQRKPVTAAGMELDELIKTGGVPDTYIPDAGTDYNENASIIANLTQMLNALQGKGGGKGGKGKGRLL